VREYRRRQRRRVTDSVAGRPDRVALWAVFMALFALAAAATSARAGQGGTLFNGGLPAPGSQNFVPATAAVGLDFGDRNLRRGLRGPDVRILNAILKSEGFRVPVTGQFSGATTRAVRNFQRQSGLARTGVVRKKTRLRLVRGMEEARATWYGPGFWGNRTACGRKLEKNVIGVAHKKLPCGTLVVLASGGEFTTARVIDRGPFTGGFTWDLTKALADLLKFEQSGSVRTAIVGR
jgi:putative peptidoglycan binding protein/rare lipoprotein A (RlpA)-like double-psi beta-barrel protein